MAGPATRTPIPTKPVAAAGELLRDKRDAIYLEILGSGVFWSINYEGRTANNFCLRIGAGYMSEEGRDPPSVFRAVFLPLTVTKLLGDRGPWPELGLGATYVSLSYRGPTLFDLVAGTDSGQTLSAGAFLMHAFIGYRWAPPATKNAVLRLGITPLFLIVDRYSIEWRFEWWGGLSIGRAF